MEESEPDPAPCYSELARRLLTEHAELFGVTPPGRRHPRAVPERTLPQRLPGVRRSPQLALPLRPRVLDGGRSKGRR